MSSGDAGFGAPGAEPTDELSPPIARLLFATAGGTAIAMIGIASTGTTGRLASEPGIASESSASPRLTSMPRSTPVPCASAGERLCSVTFETSGDGVGERLGLLVADRRIQGNVDLQALRAGNLGKAPQPERLEYFAQPEADLGAFDD